jgi:acyl-coenzyme A synthetase/AMP-(fatty) acid ligase
MIQAMNMRDYDETRRSFRLDVPPGYSFTRDVVHAWAARAPQKVALVAVGERGDDRTEHTFADVSRAANRVANALQGLGVAAGERAFVMLPRIHEWYGLLCGMFDAGVVPMPATVLCTPRDIEFRLNAADVSVAVVDEDGARKLADVRDRCPSLRHVIVVRGTGEEQGALHYAELTARASDRPPAARPTSRDDPLLVYFTSGTVAYPKMVLHTHASCAAGHEITARFWQDLTADDLHWTVSDTGWAKAAWGMLFGQWTLGASVFLWDQRGKLDVELCLRILQDSGVTTFCAPPTLYRAFVLHDLAALDLSRVRHAVSAGEPLNPEVIRIWREATGALVYDGYGQTETVNLVANFRCLPVRPGSMGKPTPTNDVDVVDDAGERLGPGEEGHLAVRTEPERPVGLLREYWRDPEATAAAFRNGWYHTGDRAVRDEDGYLWFVSRDDDVIISASYRIGPFEVESALVEHPAVAESAVVGKPDPARTSIVKAYVVLAPGYAASDELARELQDHVRTVTAPYKYPREVEFVPDLPKTISGKIRRTELRARAAAELATPTQ